MLRFYPLDSSSLDVLGYDDIEQRLCVRFRDSSEAYVYLMVPPEAFEELMAADSKGRFLNLSIKDYYAYKQLRRLPRQHEG